MSNLNTRIYERSSTNEQIKYLHKTLKNSFTDDKIEYLDKI